MKVLGIETSCDETAISVVEGESDSVRVIFSDVFSQIEVHAKYGGVIPEQAARLHLEKLAVMLRARGVELAEIDGIAVTAGPGLSPALRVGVEMAKALAYVTGKPLVGVSHMEGHIYANWIEKEAPAFPVLALLVSGGHTELVLMCGHGDYERLGETLDDAVGEAFDKVASMLSLPYPGGPQVAKLAENGNDQAFEFPRGLLDREGYDFSFSGLKTAVLYTLREHDKELADETFRANIAASFQTAVVDTLIEKTRRAIESYDPKTVVIAGGVSANLLLREKMAELVESYGKAFVMPEFKYSLDNAGMIATAGYFHLRTGEKHDPLTLTANPNLDLCAKK